MSAAPGLSSPCLYCHILPVTNHLSVVNCKHRPVCVLTVPCVCTVCSVQYFFLRRDETYIGTMQLPVCLSAHLVLHMYCLQCTIFLPAARRNLYRDNAITGLFERSPCPAYVLSAVYNISSCGETKLISGQCNYRPVWALNLSCICTVCSVQYFFLRRDETYIGTMQLPACLGAQLVLHMYCLQCTIFLPAARRNLYRDNAITGLFGRSTCPAYVLSAVYNISSCGETKLISGQCNYRPVWALTLSCICTVCSVQYFFLRRDETYIGTMQLPACLGAHLVLHMYCLQCTIFLPAARRNLYRDNAITGLFERSTCPAYVLSAVYNISSCGETKLISGQCNYRPVWALNLSCICTVCSVQYFFLRRDETYIGTMQLPACLGAQLVLHMYCLQCTIFLPAARRNLYRDNAITGLFERSPCPAYVLSAVYNISSCGETKLISGQCNYRPVWALTLSCICTVCSVQYFFLRRDETYIGTMQLPACLSAQLVLHMYCLQCTIFLPAARRNLYRDNAITGLFERSPCPAYVLSAVYNISSCGETKLISGQCNYRPV
ncbi:hypothetical protein J6590_066030 [Homalodisca vitripennis]|nr:hypothetical protein J6590_066030 [Homalodisca vitripennis]